MKPRCLTVLSLLLLPATSAQELTLRLQHAGSNEWTEHRVSAPLVFIDSPRGIGRAEFLPRPGQPWPTELQLDLGIRELEGITLTQGDRSIEGSRHAPGDLRIRRHGDRMRVGVPATLMQTNLPLRVQWVDYYR